MHVSMPDRIASSRIRRASDGAATGTAVRPRSSVARKAMTAVASPRRSHPFADGGGVLEHPEASGAWDAFALHRPPRAGGWIVADDVGGWTCCVEQGHYGHRARKATWLYANGVERPDLTWGASRDRARLDQGFHTAEERAAGKARGLDIARQDGRLSSRECWETPHAFRDVLLTMARGCVSLPKDAPSR